MADGDDELISMLRQLASVAAKRAVHAAADLKLALGAIEDVALVAGDYLRLSGADGEVAYAAERCLARLRRVAKAVQIDAGASLATTQIHVLGGLAHGMPPRRLADHALALSKQTPAGDTVRLAADATEAWASKGGRGNDKWDVLNAFLSAYGLGVTALHKSKRPAGYKHPLREVWATRPGSRRAEAKAKRRQRAKER
jgi:hypothetical protein